MEWASHCSNRSSRTCCLVVGSKLPVGSSARTSCGAVTRARAMATRWRSPLRELARGDAEGAVRSRGQLRDVGLGRAPPGRARGPDGAGTGRGCSARRRGIRGAGSPGNTNPRCVMRKERRAAGDKRSTRTLAVSISPSAGRSMPETRLSRVVFPEPLGPMAAALIPEGIRNSGTSRENPPCVYSNRTSRSSIIGIGGADDSIFGELASP